MAHIGSSKISKVRFYPFCSNELEDIAGKCVGCQYAVRAGLAISINGSDIVHGPIPCNPVVEKFPLPLAECEACNGSLINAILVFILFLSCLTVFANSWSILVWSQQKPRTPQIIFKLSLAVSDLLFGALVLPASAIYLVALFYYPHEEYYSFSTFTNSNKSPDDYERNWEALFMSSKNRFVVILWFISQCTSLLSLLFLNIDRHVAIVFNIKYKQIMTKKRSLGLVFGLWFINVVAGFATAFATSSFIIQPFALFIPVVNFVNDTDEFIKALTMYFLPLVVIFFAIFFVAISTSIKLYQQSEIHRISNQSFCSKCHSKQTRQKCNHCVKLFRPRKKARKTRKSDDCVNEKTEKIATKSLKELSSFNGGLSLQPVCQSVSEDSKKIGYAQHQDLTSNKNFISPQSIKFHNNNLSIKKRRKSIASSKRSSVS